MRGGGPGGQRDLGSGIPRPSRRRAARRPSRSGTCPPGTPSSSSRPGSRRRRGARRWGRPTPCAWPRAAGEGRGGGMGGGVRTAPPGFNRPPPPPPQGREAVGPHGAAEGLRARRVSFLHQLREPQREGVGERRLRGPSRSRSRSCGAADGSLPYPPPSTFQDANPFASVVFYWEPLHRQVCAWWWGEDSTSPPPPFGLGGILGFVWALRVRFALLFFLAAAKGRPCTKGAVRKEGTDAMAGSVGIGREEMASN